MPLHTYNKSSLFINPRGFTYLLLSVGLFVFAYAIISGNMTIAATIVAIPIAIIMCISGMQYPMLSYCIYCAVTLYFSAIYRYTEIEGLSVLYDIFLSICIISIAVNTANDRRTDVYWRNAFNILTITQLIWILFALFEQFAPYSSFNDIVRSRGFFTVIPISYLLSGLLLDSPKKLKATIVLLGVFVITAAMKAYWQKTHGWDWAETKFLMNYEAWHTHLLQSGARYFSFFSDAGNFGATMGVLCTTFGIVSFALRRFWLRWFCIGVAVLAAIGTIMSGTRGAIIIPFCGLFIYILLSKNLKAILLSIFLGGMAFSLLYFTDIGNGNAFIRRARTAFYPQEDASYNVRVENRKRFAYYLSDKPFGVGLGNHVVDTQELMKLDEEFIPTDSYWIDIWVENGIVGLCVHLFLTATVILRCCYVLFFKIHHPQLRQILAGMLGGVFGLLVNAYVGRAMGATPCSLLVPIFLSFVLNGPYIEKQIAPNYNF